MFDHRFDDEELFNLRTRFERFYARTHPRPGRQTSRLIRGALIVLVIASIIVSASHTIPAFVSTIESDAPTVVKVGVALSAFAMVEVGMLTLAYYSTRRKAEAADSHINRQLKRGLMLAFVLAVVANLHSVLEPRFGGTQLWGVASFAVFVLVGVSAPTLAYIAGEVFGLTTLADERANADADADWERDFEARWSEAVEKYKRGAVKVVRPASVSIAPPMSAALSAGQPDGQADTDKSGHATGQGYSKDSDARAKVLDHLGKFPTDMALPVRDLAEKIGVGKTTVADVKRELKGGKTNG